MGVSHPANTTGVHPPKSGGPAAILAGGHNIAEPSQNPQEPPERAPARATGQADFWGMFDRLAKAVPSPMRKVTRWKAARSAWSRRTRKITPEAIVAVGEQWAGDADVLRRHVLPGLEVWLDEMLPDLLAAAGAGGTEDLRPALAPLRLLEGAPEAVIDLIVTHKGDAWVRSWLDGARWDDEASAIVCRLGTQADKISNDLGRELRALGVTITGPSAIRAAE
jgi:hypothetical protein